MNEDTNWEIEREALLLVKQRLGIEKDQIIAMGDGANDLKFMAESGVSIAYHAKPVVRERATLAFDYVGLDGVLRLWRN